MTTTLLNQQEHLLNQSKLRKLADWLAEKLEARTEVPWSEVCVVLVDDKGIVPANLEYFGKNRPTDVISFRYDPVPGEDGGFSGDLIINVDRAVKVGPEQNGADYELALYIAHGFDHLSGAEDDTPEKKQAMLDTETAWLREATAQGWLEGLFE
jgi:probable rRNA maturation factor